jgi:hypothetical protein
MSVYGDDCGSQSRCVREGKGGIEFSLSEPTSLWWIMLAVWVLSTRMMSTGLAAPDSRDPLSCTTTSLSDPLETQSGPCVGIQFRSYSSVNKLLDGDPDSGTSFVDEVQRSPFWDSRAR